MKANFSADAKRFKQFVTGLKLTRYSIQEVAKPAVATISNKQIELVPGDTGATRASIKQHDVTVRDDYFETDIGAETNYAPFIENGREDMPNYPMQPFIRPSIYGNERNILRAIANGVSFHVKTKAK